MAYDGYERDAKRQRMSYSGWSEHDSNLGLPGPGFMGAGPPGPHGISNIRQPLDLVGHLRNDMRGFSDQRGSSHGPLSGMHHSQQLPYQGDSEFSPTDRGYGNVSDKSLPVGDNHPMPALRREDGREQYDPFEAARDKYEQLKDYTSNRHQYSHAGSIEDERDSAGYARHRSRSPISPSHPADKLLSRDPRLLQHATPVADVHRAEDDAPRSRVEWGRDSIGMSVSGLQRSLGVLWDDWEIHRERCDKNHNDFIKHLLGLHKYHCILKPVTVSVGCQTDKEDQLTSKLHHITGLDRLRQQSLTVPLELPALTRHRPPSESISVPSGVAPATSVPGGKPRAPLGTTVPSHPSQRATADGSIPEEAVSLPELRTSNRQKKLLPAKGIPMSQLEFVSDPNLPGVMMHDSGKLVVRKVGNKVYQTTTDPSTSSSDMGIVGKIPINSKGGVEIASYDQFSTLNEVMSHISLIAVTPTGKTFITHKLRSATPNEVNNVFMEIRNHTMDLVLDEHGALVIAETYKYLADDQKRFLVRGFLLKFATILASDVGVRLLIHLKTALMEQSELLETVTQNKNVIQQLTQTPRGAQLACQLMFVAPDAPKYLVRAVQGAMPILMTQCDEELLMKVVNYFTQHSITFKQMWTVMIENIADLLSFPSNEQLILEISRRIDQTDEIRSLIGKLIYFYRTRSDAPLLKQINAVLPVLLRKMDDRMKETLSEFVNNDYIAERIIDRKDWEFLSALLNTNNLQPWNSFINRLTRQTGFLDMLFKTEKGAIFLDQLTGSHAKNSAVKEIMNSSMTMITSILSSSGKAIKILRGFVCEAASEEFRDMIIAKLMDHIKFTLSSKHGSWLLREALTASNSSVKREIFKHVASMSLELMKELLTTEMGAVFICDVWINIPSAQAREKLMRMLRCHMATMKETPHCVQLYAEICDESEFIPHLMKHIVFVSAHKLLRDQLLNKVDQATVTDRKLMADKLCSLPTQDMAVILNSAWGPQLVARLMAKVSLDDYKNLQNMLKSNKLLLSRMAHCGVLMQIISHTPMA